MGPISQFRLRVLIFVQSDNNNYEYYLLCLNNRDHIFAKASGEIGPSWVLELDEPSLFAHQGYQLTPKYYQHGSLRYR